MKFPYITLVAVLAAIAVAPGHAAMQGGAQPVKTDMPGVVNFSRIDHSSGFAGSTVGFGGATQPSAMSPLRGAGFATVIGLRFGSEAGAEIEASRVAAEAAGLKYIHLPFDPKNPGPKVPDTEVIGEFLDALGDKANQPVYIHCNSATRVAALWMIGRVLVDGWEIDAAGKEAALIAAKPEEAIAFTTRYIESRRE